MKRLIIAIILVALLSLSAVALHSYKSSWEFPRKYGVSRVTNYDPRVNFAKIDTTVYLEPAEADKGKGVGRGGYSPIYPRGTAQIKSSSWYGYPRAQVFVKVKDLPPSYEAAAQFEAWLVDDDTGHRLSVGTFTTGFGGVGLVTLNIDTYLDPYDLVEVTIEPIYDTDIAPGPALLIGPIPAPEYFNPPPRSSKMISTGFTRY